MSNEVQHPGRVNLSKVENDYINNGHPNPSDPQFRWNGPKPRAVESHSAIAARARAEKEAREKPTIDALRAATEAKGKPLTFDERAAVLASVQ